MLLFLVGVIAMANHYKISDRMWLIGKEAQLWTMLKSIG